MVLKPSRQIFLDMLNVYMTAPSYNKGDQGFINWYFYNYTGYSTSQLSPIYNVPAKMKVRVSSAFCECVININVELGYREANYC